MACEFGCGSGSDCRDSKSDRAVWELVVVVKLGFVTSRVGWAEDATEGGSFSDATLALASSNTSSKMVVGIGVLRKVGRKRDRRASRPDCGVGAVAGVCGAGVCRVSLVMDRVVTREFVLAPVVEMIADVVSDNGVFNLSIACFFFFQNSPAFW